MARNSGSLPSSTTHAGGIQPSASFFRPSRPSDYSPPATPDIPLTPLAYGHHHHHHHENVHDDQETDVDEAEHDGAQFVTLKRIRQSREPLLPAPSSSSLSSRDPPLSPTRLVRNSFDRVLTIGRGMSFDSIRLSSAKLADEEAQTQGQGQQQQRKRDSVRSLSPPSAASVTASSPSPEPRSLSFNPTPAPDQLPPLSAMPLVDPSTKRPYRRWQLHPSRNRFFFNGRILTGGDTPWAFVASFTLLLSIAASWFATSGVWWWLHVSPAVTIVVAYLTLLTISTMFSTATTDPGILPRNLDPDPPYSTTSPSDTADRVPMPRDLKVRSDVVRVKYCPTCKTYRPPRSSHCKMCDNCVDGCDHHCQWVNNCIGRRNYTTFFALLMSATTTLILIIVTTALHLYYITTNGRLTFRETLTKPGSIVAAIAFGLSICVIWPVAALLSYHMRLLLLNITTIEQIRNQALKSLVPNGPPPPNPFSHGTWKRNLLAVLCRPSGFSWLDAQGVVTEDRRSVNPAYEVDQVEAEGEDGRLESVVVGR